MMICIGSLAVLDNMKSRSLFFSLSCILFQLKVNDAPIVLLLPLHSSTLVVGNIIGNANGLLQMVNCWSD